MDKAGVSEPTGGGSAGAGKGPRGSTPAAWRLLAPAGLAAILVFVFFDFLLGDGSHFPSHWLGDTHRYFVAARSFGAEQILQGNLPLWNPHSFAGTPFVGVFQSSVLYPINAIYLVLPLARAISLEFALHLFLLGLFTHLWLRRRRLHPLACFFAAASASFGGACFLRVLAGALTVIDTLAWTPLVLLSIDGLAERVGRSEDRSCPVGMHPGCSHSTQSPTGYRTR